MVGFNAHTAFERQSEMERYFSCWNCDTLENKTITIKYAIIEVFEF